jgi:hypothetical protein
MGYAGYVPAKYAEAKSDLQLALAGVDDADALALLSTLTKNAVVAPGEPKYRRVKAGNARLAAARSPEFDAALAALGWVLTADGEAFELPAGRAAMEHARWIEDAKDAQVKRARTSMVKAVSGNRLGAGADAVRAQLAADAAERAAAEPVTAAAKATPLPAGANVMLAADAGINGG